MKLPFLFVSLGLLSLGASLSGYARVHGPERFSCQVDYIYKGIADSKGVLEAVEEKGPRTQSESDSGLQTAHVEIERLDRTVDITFGLDGKLLVVIGKLSTGDVQRTVPIAQAYESLETGEVVTALPVSKKQEKTIMQDLLGGNSSVAVQGAQVVCELTLSQ